MNTQQFLDDRGIGHQVIPHGETFSAQRLAESLHTPGDAVAKSVVVDVDGNYILAILQATHRVDLARIRMAFKARSAALVDELKMFALFPDCEFGALPPFGSQYGIKTLVDLPLTEKDQITFEGNAHDIAISMKYSDFAELERPIVASFTHHA